MSVHVIEFTTETGANGETYDMVHYAGSGDALFASTWARVADFQARNGRPVGEQAEIVWSFIEPAYKAWKEGLEIPENGTPLAAWGGMGSQQIKAFRRAGLKTIEDVAEMNDTVMGRIQMPNVRSYRDQAKTYLEGRDTAELAKQISARDDQMRVMQAEMEKMRAAMANYQNTNKPEAKGGRPAA